MDSPGYQRYKQRKLAWLEHCGLQQSEEWPLFGVRKQISEIGQQVWARITDMPPLEGHPDGLRHALDEVRRLEYRLESEGLVGWIQVIDKGNWTMRRWTELSGAVLYAETEQHWYFRKVADPARFPRTIRELLRRHKGVRHGTA